LKRNVIACLKKAEENINVYVVVGQMADVDLRGRVLRCNVPQHAPVAGVARG
jgi:hypothetical protein